MRNILIGLLLLTSHEMNAQLIADPALDQVLFTSLAGNVIDDTMPLGYIAQLNVPIKNLDNGNGLPAGSCKIKIGLGSKMILAPSFDLSTAVTSDYFRWTEEFVGGQVQLTGELVAPLPANYSAIAIFNVQGNVLDYSTITSNFLVTNHNTQVILSDNDPSNNTSFRRYKIIPPNTTPVSISQFSAVKKDCNIFVSFNANNEVNVMAFEIESSKDGIHFTTSAVIDATRRPTYQYNLAISPQLSADILYLRVKSVDRDGATRYSNIKLVNAVCSAHGTALKIFPNPLIDGHTLTIKPAEGLLTGLYLTELFDAKGSLISTRQYHCNGLQQLMLETGHLSSGQYLLRITNDRREPLVFKIQKQ